MPADGTTNGSREVHATGLKDVLELRLPAKAEYLPVLRATTGVVAGQMAFNYDEIIHVRTAVSEAFDLAIRRLERGSSPSAPTDLTIRFTITEKKLEIFLPSVVNDQGRSVSSEEEESEALLASLMDEVELDRATGEGPSLRLVKYKGTD